MKRKSLSQTLIDTAKDLGFSKTTIDQLESLGIPEANELSPKKIKKIRQKINVSQSVFAAFLNVTISTVHKWERGSAQPRGSALRLLSIIDSKGIDVLLPHSTKRIPS